MHQRVCLLSLLAGAAFYLDPAKPFGLLLEECDEFCGYLRTKLGQVVIKNVSQRWSADPIVGLQCLWVYPIGHKLLTITQYLNGVFQAVF